MYSKKMRKRTGWVVVVAFALGLAAVGGVVAQNADREALADRTPVSGTLTFNPGETSQTFTVPITDDAVDESNETVTSDLSNPGHATLGTPASATLTITDNDPPPSAEVPLQPGWNLISVPRHPVDTSVTSVLSSIDGQYDLVYAYDASDAVDPWKKYNTAAPSFLNDLTDIDETMGLWIRATEPVTLTLSGSVPSTARLMPFLNASASR